jgi:hypothetical protein
MHRVIGGGEFPPQQVDLNYFINIIAKGGPSLYRVGERKKYYTGDTINPLLIIRYKNGEVPDNVNIKLHVTRPSESTGNVLSKSKLRNATSLDADTIPARQSTLMALDTEKGQPVINYEEHVYDMFDDPANTEGVFESHGLFGNQLKDILLKEGNYTFRAIANYGDGCIASRELSWSMHVDCGIDAADTQLQTSVVSTLPDGSQNIHIIFTPKDKYGNNLGPGRTDISVTGAAGSTVSGTLNDNGDGSYSIDVVWDPASGDQPGIVIAQPERPAVAATNPCPPPVKGNNKKLKFWIYFLLLLLLILIFILIFVCK